MDANKFYEKIAKFRKEVVNRDFETFLLALYRQVLVRKEEALTFDLTFEMLLKSFTAEPAEFDSSWLSIITNPAFQDFEDETNTTALAPYDYTIAILQFQIAELHKMRGKQLEEEYRYFGIDSETGHRWFNFDPITSLECGMACIDDNNADFATIDWSFIGMLLENGRIYE